jgi:hypothetical protein
MTTAAEQTELSMYVDGRCAVTARNDSVRGDFSIKPFAEAIRQHEGLRNDLAKAWRKLYQVTTFTEPGSVRYRRVEFRW